MLELLNQLDGFQPNTQVKVSIFCHFSGEENEAKGLSQVPMLSYLHPGLPSAIYDCGSTCG
jgi:hypothetical protein